MKAKNIFIKNLVVISVLVLAGCGTFEIGIENNTIPEVTVETVEGPVESVPITITEEPTAQSPQSDESAISAALEGKLGASLEELPFVITQNTGTHAKGNVSNGYFLAAKQNGTWLIVYDGQAYPPCMDIELYKFPSAMVPECLDENDQLVVRMADDVLGGALAEFLGVSLADLDYRMGQMTDAHAKGWVDNGNFLAIKAADGWNIVYVGEATPECAQVEPYGFPTNMVPECLDENNQLVVRSGGEETRIGEALAEYFGVPLAELDYTVIQDTGTHALGYMPDGYFLAAKAGDKWLIAYDGHGTPYCAQVDLHNFPAGMVPECMDASNNLVLRTGNVVPPEPSLKSLDCGAGSVGASPGTVEYVACNVQDGLRSRNISALPSFMADPFTIGYWQSEGIMDTPAEMVKLLPDLYNYNSPDYTPRLTFTIDRNQFPNLDGIPLEGMFGSDINIALIVYSEGWGLDGQGGSLLFFTQDEQGSYSWHGMGYSANNFSP